MKKKTLSLALALVMCLSAPVVAAEGDTYKDDYFTLTNFTEEGERDPFYGQYLYCKAPAVITLTKPIAEFTVTQWAGEGEDDGKPMEISNLSTYVGHSGVTITNPGATVTLTEPGEYGMGIYGDENDTLKEAPPKSHNLGSDVYGSYVIIVLPAEETADPATPDTTNTPDAPAETIPASGTSYASTQTVTVDGKAVEFQMYALKDEKGNPTNYIKLRDLAQILSGTEAQFAVGYDNAAKAISVTTGEAYTPNGSEMQTPFSGDRSYTGGAKSVNVDGEAVEMTAITLTDDAGGGYTYFKLRDLGKVLGFNTGWTREQGVFVESNKSYTE